MAKKKFNYSEALARVESIAQEVENESLDVDALATRVKEAIALLQECKGQLRKTEEDLNDAISQLED